MFKTPNFTLPPISFLSTLSPLSAFSTAASSSGHSSSAGSNFARSMEQSVRC
jgi:hypothetical protein